MSKHLIIPDVHNKTPKLIKLLSRIGDKYDSIIQLGDWVDDFGDNAETIASVATDINFLDKNYPMVYLWGNHDLPYRYPSKHTMCPGFTLDKQKALIGTIDKHIWDEFSLFLEVDGYLLSHAGFNELPEDSLSVLDEGFHRDIVEETNNSGALNIGKGRGGWHKNPGPLWMDWTTEFTGVKGVKQIVGHTPYIQPRWKGLNLCLDTHLRHYATLEDGHLEVHAWPTTKK